MTSMRSDSFPYTVLSFFFFSYSQRKHSQCVNVVYIKEKYLGHYFRVLDFLLLLLHQKSLGIDIKMMHFQFHWVFSFLFQVQLKYTPRWAIVLLCTLLYIFYYKNILKNSITKAKGDEKKKKSLNNNAESMKWIIFSTWDISAFILPRVNTPYTYPK